MTTPRGRVAAGRAWWQQSLWGQGYTRIRELDLDTHALALCAQQVLCTAPLIVAISAVLQRASGRNISFVIAKFFGLHDDSAEDIQRIFGRTSSSISTTALVVGMITAVIFTTSVAAVQQRGFELIWTLPRVSGVRSYFRQLAWAPALAVFSAAILAAARFGRMLDTHLDGVGPWAAPILQGAITLLFYWWTQHWLLGGRVGWRALLPGAVTVGVLTTIVVRLSRVVMPEQISWQVHAYGLIGGVFVLSVWLMVLSVVILGGVLFGALVSERRADPSRRKAGDSETTPLTLEGLTSAAEDQQVPASRR